MTTAEYEWVECRCGKVREVGPTQLEVRLAKMSLCRSCEMDIAKAMNRCPETVGVPGGAAACILDWAHTGRCEPFTITDDEIRAARAAALGRK